MGSEIESGPKVAGVVPEAAAEKTVRIAYLEVVKGCDSEKMEVSSSLTASSSDVSVLSSSSIGSFLVIQLCHVFYSFLRYLFGRTQHKLL